MEEYAELVSQIAVLKERSTAQEKAFERLETKIEEYLKSFEEMYDKQGEKLHKMDLRMWLIVFALASISGGASSVLLKLLG